MGFEAFGWHRKSSEAGVIRAEQNVGYRELIAKSARQAERFAHEHQNAVTVFVGSGFRERILSAKDDDGAIEDAKKISKDNPHLVPDTIEDNDERAAFLVALARELDKPQYRQ